MKSLTYKNVSDYSRYGHKSIMFEDWGVKEKPIAGQIDDSILAEIDKRVKAAKEPCIYLTFLDFDKFDTVDYSPWTRMPECIKEEN